MKILFLTMTRVETLHKRGIFIDLLNCFKEDRHNICVVAPRERRYKGSTGLTVEEGVKILNVRTFNLVKTSIVEKGIGQLLLESQFLRAVKKYLPEDEFDLVLYSTPPINLTKVVRFIKERDKAHAYLLLKDIFPQNAVDMGLMRKDGFLHRYFRRKEKKLYALSDTIGCMSPANKKYILKHNPEINDTKVEVNPNSITPFAVRYSPEEKIRIRVKYGLPADKRIFVYGGNLGIPQGIDFLIEVLEHFDEPDAHFLIVGNGTKYKNLKKWFEEQEPPNASLFQWLPKNEYDQLLAACDVGLLFLDPRFTIPNFPSRLLSYLEMSLPVIAATDDHTDLGTVIEEAGCGISVLSGDIVSMLEAIHTLSTVSLVSWKKNARNLLQEKYTAEHSYQMIREKIKGKVCPETAAVE